MQCASKKSPLLVECSFRHNNPTFKSEQEISLKKIINKKKDTIGCTIVAAIPIYKGKFNARSNIFYAVIPSVSKNRHVIMVSITLFNRSL